MNKIREIIRYIVLYIWIWLAVKLGFEYMDVYSPDDENVTAITVSNSEKYIDKISKIK